MMKINNKCKNVRYIAKLVYEPKLWFVIFVPICTIVLGQKTVVASWLTAQIFNELQSIVNGNRAVSILYNALIYAILIFALDIVQWLLSTLSDLIENYWREHVNINLQNKFMLKDYKSNVSDFDNPELISQRSVARNVDPVGVIKSVISLIATVCVTISFTIILWQYSPVLVIVALIVKLPTFFLYDRTMKLNRAFKIESGNISREKNYYHGIPVDKSTAKEYKIYSMKNYICSKYNEASSKYLLLFKHAFIKMATNNSILMYYDEIITIIVEIAIGLSVFYGKMLFGDFTLFVAAFNNLSGSMEKITDFVAQFKDMHEQNNMLIEYLESSNIYESGEEIKTEVKGKTHTIEFRNVSFAYPGTEKKVICDLNMTILAGKTYGLVGLNGSGKSTLVSLLLRLYEPDSGEILLNGINIKEYNINSYYESLACVFQSITKYAMPIKEYIASGKQCDIKKAEDALSQVKLNEWCRELPHGLDTMLTRAFSSESNSVEPSIGQWQKLSIARAIYKDSPIMVLDEPSASLDVDTENEIFNYIAQLTVKKTAILISHRLSNITECDYIYLLQDGKIAEEGTHHELLEEDGIYAKLFKSQAKHYHAI